MHAASRTIDVSQHDDDDDNNNNNIQSARWFLKTYFLFKPSG
jgi:hypothetical protein